MQVSPLNKMTILLVVLLASLTPLALGQETHVGFYAATCPTAESIVQSVVQSAVKANPKLAAGLLRMHFHDCFVNGCDASILIDGPLAEKTAPPNSVLKGFEVIEAAKAQLETACPGVVSCADILALAARDSVVLSNGAGWGVPTGRRDGLISQASDASSLPFFKDPVSVQIQKFGDKGLNIQDLVTLSGGHTIGTTACQLMYYRLYNYTNNGPDPTINQLFLPQLQTLCPLGGDKETRVDLDPGSPLNFDISYYDNLRNGRGILESDQNLWSDPRTRRFVQQFLADRGALGLRFDVEFGRAMVKMGNIELKTGIQGEIRRVCNKVN